MAKIRKGNKSALLIVDVQVGVMRDVWEASRIIDNIGTSVEKARKQNIPVIWVQHSDEELVSGSPDWQLHPELSPQEEDVRIYKHSNSAFEETALEETLAQLGVTHIVLAGAATNWCIRATAYAALERGYDLILIEDAHTTRTIELQNDRKIKAEDIIDELNIVMEWVSYPGRKNRSVSAADLDFVFDDAD